MRTTQEYSDKTAISLSVLCLLHCLLVPSFLVFLSGYLSLSYNNELIHYGILFIAISLTPLRQWIINSIPKSMKFEFIFKIWKQK